MEALVFQVCSYARWVCKVAWTLWLTARTASSALELKKAVWLLFIITRVARVGRAARTSSHAAGYAF
jgi:hypothetical protein